MTFALDPEVAVVLEQAGPMPAPPPAGDVEARRGALNGMLEHFNNVAQPIASDVDTIDYDIPAADGTQLRARWWLAARAEELGVDPNRIALMGDSAGGGIAAGDTILSRDRGGPALARQILLYPMLDDRNTNVDPHIAPFAGWSYDDNVTGWDALLGERGNDTHVEPSAAPARFTDASRLPPAYIEVGQLDILRDEDVTYALTLSHAGVPVELHLHPGVPHEYDAIAYAADVSRRAVADRHRVLKSL